MARFDDQVVVITGGSGAIGAETAKKFHAEGAKVVLVDLNEEALKQVAAEIGGDRVSYYTAEVTENDAVVGYVKDRKSTRLNSSHVAISYAVFCLKKKTKNTSRW